MEELSGRYRLLRRLGEGGMGVVHEALDLRLDRHVAIKTIRVDQADHLARERFFREARAAAAVSHPHACQLHEIGEHDGQPFLVMELLDGEPLATRLLRGVLPPDEAVRIIVPVLSALQALHARGLVHRDLKPSNVFLTPHGVKLLDFGLARPASASSVGTAPDLTMPGTIAGTPRYMAPEQLTGDAVSAQTDVYAAGVLLYEMVTGRTPFEAATTLALLQKVLNQEPPRLTGAPEIAALDPVVHRALQRDPANRYASAEEMAADLRSDRTIVVARPPQPPAVKLVVLPFRFLRADEELAFLEVALPDAITTSLSPITSLVVRSPMAAAKFGAVADPAALASTLDVNHVLTGTLLRAGPQVRVTCQLVEAPGGRVRWSQTLQVALGDLFQLQDDIARHIVDSLPIEAGSERQQDVPASARAYELYLRANWLAQEHGGWITARTLYQQCVDEDPNFAPAWARLGRMHRVIGKYVDDDHRPAFRAAEEAFQRAFALNPDLSIAHYLYVYLEVETGRADQALVRLADRIRRHPHQAELLGALCQAARYCGLLDVSVAAHDRARRLDPQIQTSVAYTHLIMGEYRALLASAPGETSLVRAYAYHGLGASVTEVVQVIDQETRRFPAESIGAQFGIALRAAISGDREDALRRCRTIYQNHERFPDGEGIYNVVRVGAFLGDVDLAVSALERVVEMGFFCAPGFERDPWLEPLRGSPRYRAVLDKATARYEAARRAFEAAGGYQVLDSSGTSRAGRPT